MEAVEVHHWVCHIWWPHPHLSSRHLHLWVFEALGALGALGALATWGETG